MNKVYKDKKTGEYWTFLGKQELGPHMDIFNVYESMDGKSRRYIPVDDPINANMEVVDDKKD